MMWKYTNWKKSIKIIISVFLFIIGTGYSSGDIESPTIEMKNFIVFQLNDSITTEMILDKAAVHAIDNQTAAEILNFL